MRLLFVITGLKVGGAETQLAGLATALARGGWEVKVAAFTTGTEIIQRLAAGGVSVEVAGDGGPVHRLRWLIRLVKSHRAECVITFMLQANVLGRVAARLVGVPVISSIRNTRFGGNSKIGARVGDLLERSTSRLARATVVNSRYAAAELVERGVVSEHNVVVIPNGVMVPSVERLAPNLSEHRGQRGRFSWLAVGRLAPQKNFAALIQAFQEVTRSSPGAVLRIAGDGPLRDELTELIFKMGMSGSVELLGERQDIGALLCESEAFVLASKWEGMPNVVMEAMAMGTPTLATAVGGVPELIEPEVTGWLAESPEPEDLAAGMLSVMALAPGERRLIAEAGRQYIADNYGPDKMVERWRSVIEDAVQQRLR